MHPGRPVLRGTDVIWAGCCPTSWHQNGGACAALDVGMRELAAAGASDAPARAASSCLPGGGSVPTLDLGSRC